MTKRCSLGTVIENLLMLMFMNMMKIGVRWKNPMKSVRIASNVKSPSSLTELVFVPEILSEHYRPPA